MKVSIQNILFHCFTSQFAIKASLLKFSMFSVHKNTISNMFLEFSNFKIVHLILIGEVKLLFQNFVFHRVLGEVKLQCIDPKLFVSSVLGEVKI